MVRGSNQRGSRPVIERLREVVGDIERAWSLRRLLVVGDVMLDKYVWGKVGRISPEAPVPVVSATHQSERPGGAGNVALNLARLGAQVMVAGFTGDDKDGALLADNLRQDGITPIFVTCEGFPTVAKLRVIGGRQQMLRIDYERLSPRPQQDYDCLVQRVLEQLPGCHAVVLSDYAKGALSAEVCQSVIQAARGLSIPVLVDPKSEDFARYRGATTICPNLHELTQALRRMGSDGDMENLDSVLAAAERIVSACDLAFLTTTLSEKGIALVRAGSRLVAPAVGRQVFDVSGAGDTVIAVLALCLASGLEPEVGVQLANVAAGVVVGKVGTVPVEKHELLAALAPEIALHAADKVVTRSELLARVALWKANSERVVFTNGCFDLLHVGHITLLEQARRFGDRLIVAINSDASVRGLKGSGRPIVGERERARVLAALAAVDAVVVFGEATPLELIVAVQPDVIVKGGDYGHNDIVGATEVESWGGEVKIVPILEGFSTTRLLAQGGDEKAR
jgi:D-beta-D-heptose 7-phosphate kinase/D-beta-D-heptose 1-phosphate adenosyltransferase